MNYHHLERFHELHINSDGKPPTKSMVTTAADERLLPTFLPEVQVLGKTCSLSHIMSFLNIGEITIIFINFCLHCNFFFI